jgi:hypothetical protein
VADCGAEGEGGQRDGPGCTRLACSGSGDVGSGYFLAFWERNKGVLLVGGEGSSWIFRAADEIGRLFLKGRGEEGRGGGGGGRGSGYLM